MQSEAGQRRRRLKDGRSTGETIGFMQLEHDNVKLLAESPAEPGASAGVDAKRADRELEPLIPIFHNWIQGRVFGDELLLDIADYRHVPAGPGVVLIGHEGNYSVDNTGNRLGVRYNRKLPLEGTNVDRLQQAARAALTACQRLEGEPQLSGKLRFSGREIEIFFNDRLLAPNTEETREAARADLAGFLGKLFRGAGYSLAYESDPRKLFGVSVKASRFFSAAELLAHLA